MNTIAIDAELQTKLAYLCADHLNDEERLLRLALPMVREVKAAFQKPNADSLTEALNRREELGRYHDDLQRKRKLVCAAIAQAWPGTRDSITLSAVVGLLRLELQDPLLSQLAFVRQMAGELAALNYWVSVHVRIHADAYESILRGLIGSAAGSGRYDPRGKAEMPEYRSLVEIHG